MSSLVSERETPRGKSVASRRHCIGLLRAANVKHHETSPWHLSYFLCKDVGVGVLLVVITSTLWPLMAVASGVDNHLVQVSQVSSARAARLKRGINLSHWFAQAPENGYSKTRLDSFITSKDLALIESLGFDHVRLSIETQPLLDTADAGLLKTDYLRHLDHALDLILKHELALIVDIHPSDEFKVRFNQDDRHVENFIKFWNVLAKHLSNRDPERVFLEGINEPRVEDPYRWYGIQAKIIAAMRSGAPKHTIIASGHRWSSLWELLALEPYSDPNVIYNFHSYEPFVFTHQGASWAGPNVQFYRQVPYPSSPEAVARMLETVIDAPARLVLLAYGEDRWDASRIDKTIAEAARWAVKHRVPLICNEFGVYKRFSSPSARAAWITDMRVAFEKHGIGWTMWDYAGGFGVVTRENGRTTPDAETVKALGLRPAGN